MSMKVKEALKRALDARLVPFLEGSPGVAKTEITRQTAEEFNLKLVDVRLPTMDPTDIGGLPMPEEYIDSQGNSFKRLKRITDAQFPIVGDELPLKHDKEGKPYKVAVLDDNDQPLKDSKGKPIMDWARYDGWLIAFEEITSCVPAMQAAAYRILLEREVGEHKLHPAVEMVATGNKDTDKAVVLPMSTALRTRLCIIPVEAELAGWMKWARAKGIDHRITSYLQWRPENLHKFDPKIKQLNCPVPRTWEFADRVLKQDDGSLDSITLLLLEGVIGTVANEFFSFLQIFGKLPDITKILKDPANADMPTEAGHQYALASVMANELAKNDKNVPDLVTYVGRMDPELQTVTYMDTLRLNRRMLGNKHISNWITANRDMVNAEI